MEDPSMHLANYGAKRDPLTIYDCEGSYLNTSHGRLLDWILGQVSHMQPLSQENIQHHTGFLSTRSRSC